MKTIRQSKKVKRMIFDGNNAEDIFFYIMNMIKRPIRRSSENQNKYQHIDFFIGNKSYDIKSRAYQNVVWLEAKGIYGHDGWLLGKSDYIVIYYIDIQKFCFYKRLDLLDFAKKFRKKSTSKKYYHWYSRQYWGRKDLCLLVKKLDLNKYEQHSIVVSNI